MITSEKPYVVLRGREFHNVFYSSNTLGEDPRFSVEGELWYDVIGFCDTHEEAYCLIDEAIQGRYELIQDPDEHAFVLHEMYHFKRARRNNGWTKEAIDEYNKRTDEAVERALEGRIPRPPV